MHLPFFTIGHSTRQIPAFVDLLRAGGVGLVVDVRTVPRSRTNPQYNEDALPEGLAPYHVGYSRIAELGGLRSKAREVAPGVNGWWDNQSFHNYADYALSVAFRDGLDQLVALGRERRLAIMCSEAVWWRCHRRIIADYLLARGEAVLHLMGDKRVDAARLTPAAQLDRDAITYPAEGAEASSQPSG